MATEVPPAPGGDYQPPSGGGMTTTAAGGYPARLDVEYPDQLNRWLPLVKWLLAIPHFVVLYFIGLVAYLIAFIGIFIILFSAALPRDLWNFIVNYLRWNANVTAYSMLMRDEYPPFSWDAGLYPVTFDVDYPEQLNRFLPLVKWLLAFPHYIVLAVLWIAAGVVWIIALFVILFTRAYPRGLFNFVEGVLRWSYRVTAYVYLLRDEYPPFSLNP